MTEPREWNCLAAAIERLEDSEFRESVWTNSSTFTFRFGSCEFEQNEFHYLEQAFKMMSYMVDDSPNPLLKQKTGAAINQPARELLASFFLKMLRDGASPPVLYAYAITSWQRFEELNRDITVDDIILIDTWMADQESEHYYGPERIY